jgi:hypothetical protein
MQQAMGTIDSGEKSKYSIWGLAAFKYVSGFVLGLTLALIGQEILGYGNLSFIFVVLISIAAFVKLAMPWKYVGVLVFDLVAILFATLLKMYILIAPNL